MTNKKRIKLQMIMRIAELSANLVAKEQECERLREELSTYGATGICETCTEKSVLRNDKYTKTLREIKEISENFIKNVSDRCIETTRMYGVHTQILQKISEVENEN